MVANRVSISLGKFRGINAIQNIFELFKLFGIDLRTVDSNKRRRLMTSNVDRGRSELPRERNCLGRVVDRSIATLGRRCLGTVDQMDLIAKIIILVVTNLSTIRKTESLTILLSNHNALGNSSRAVALRELIRIGISLNRRAEVLRGHKAQILDVIGIERRSLCTGRGFRNLRKTIPGNTLTISRPLYREENTMVYAGFIQSFTRLVPNDSTHEVKSSFLIMNCEYIMIQIVRNIMPIKSTSRNTGNGLE